MTTKYDISIDSDTPVSITETDSILVVSEGVTLSTVATAIDATGLATQRGFYINGTVVSATGDAFLFGSTAFSNGDSDSEIVVSALGRISGADTGVRIDSGGLDFVNDGTVEARLIAIASFGDALSLVNTGLIASSAGVGVTLSGSNAIMINHGTVHAAGDALRLASGSAQLTNNGELRSDTASALVSIGTTATLTNHGSIVAHDTAVLSSGADATITNDGAIRSEFGGAIAASGDRAIVTTSGTVNASDDAITLSGDDGKITNSGLVQSAHFGISVSGDNAIVTNYNTISADGGIETTGSRTTVSNYGTITGTTASAATIDFSGAEKSILHNFGLVKSAATAFLGSTGADSVFNSGTITGTIKLGGGNDYFDGTGGKVNGTVAGGSGNDVYAISDASIKIVETARSGMDLVKSAVSFTLPTNVENLTLTGKAAINAAGNTLANQLHGNSGANRVDGKAGNDTIWGHGGADILTGGTGADQFVFATKDGKDTITDFAASGSAHDILDLTSLSDITDYKDLKQHHMTQVGNHVMIDGLNGDSILLKNVKLAALDAGDFLF